MAIFQKKENQKSLLLIQGSLNPESFTSVLIEEVGKLLKKRGVAYDVLDIRTVDMDFCDGRPIEKYNPDTQRAYNQVKQADGYIFGMPVYSYSISGALKNLIDITSGAMEKKVAGILCNSGGPRSYLASVDLMKILSFEADVVTVQPVVHTDRNSFREGTIFDDQVLELINEMIDALMKYLRVS